jgi:hypothetical protein
MRLASILTQPKIFEANVAAKIKDPKIVKQVSIAMRHDPTVPKNKIAALGVKPTEEQIMQLWSDLLDGSLRTTDYGDISADGKFDEWLTRLYINGVVDYEDINGEGGDALGAWKALSVRSKLKPEHQDFNKFRSLQQIQQIVRIREYRDELERVKDAETVEKHKREKKELTLIDNDRFLVTMPFNYGACYTFNNSVGFRASFCTGSSNGLTWFNRYAKDGPVISIIDKENLESANGKWQMHGPSSQMNNGDQTMTYSRGDKLFAELFPGLLKKIAAAMQANAAEIKDSSTEIVPDGYDVAAAISDIKNNLPYSWASEAEEETPAEQDPNDGPGTYIVTQLASGRTARIDGESRQDIINKLTTRYPDSTEADYTIEKAQEEQ